MNARKLKFLVLGLIIAVGLKAQVKDTVVLKSVNFTGVKANSGLKIILVQSDSNKVVVNSPNYEKKKLVVEVKDGVLKLEPRGLSDVDKVTVYSPKFDFIDLSGAATIKIDGVISGDLLRIENSGASDVQGEVNYLVVEVVSSGASDVKLRGKVDTMSINISGASDVKAFDVKNIYTYIDASGASDVQVNADSVLIANLSGASSVKFQKEPAFKEINATGGSSVDQPQSVWIEAEDSEFSVTENEDTTKIQINGTEIIVIETEGDTKVLKRKVEPISKKKKPKFKGNWAGLELGVNGFMSPNYSLDLPTEYSYLELNYPKSLNFNINFFQQSVQIFGPKFGMVTGMGLQWNNYRFYNSATTLMADSGKLQGYYNTTVGRSYSKSKLTTMYLTVPLIFEFQTNAKHETNSFHLGAGVIGGVRLSSHTKQVYSFDGSGKNKPKTWDEFYLQPFRLDATLRLGWGPLNLYGNYSITQMFRKGKGPELYPFSIGLILPFS